MHTLLCPTPLFSDEPSPHMFLLVAASRSVDCATMIVFASSELTLFTSGGPSDPLAVVHCHPCGDSSCSGPLSLSVSCVIRSREVALVAQFYRYILAGCPWQDGCRGEVLL